MSPYLFEALEEFSPAQHFSEHEAFFGVQLMEERMSGRGQDAVSQIAPALVFVSSGRELVPADTDILRGRGYYVRSLPAPPSPRFSPPAIQRFLEEKFEPPHPGDLYHEVREHFDSRIDYTHEAQCDVVALYAIGTYVHRLFDTFPYLAFTGSKASGKSKNGKLLGELAFNAVEAVTLTGGALYLEVEAHAATLLLDDREDLAGDEAKAINAMLNAGYKRGGATIRGSWDTQTAKRFGIYSPKVLTSIKGVNEVLGSRCIHIRMQPSDNDEKRKKSEDVGAPFWQDCRDKLYVWALGEWQTVRICYRRQDIADQTLPDGRGVKDLSGRAWELWKPVLALGVYFQEFGHIEGLADRVLAYCLDSQEWAKFDSAESREGVILHHVYELLQPSGNGVGPTSSFTAADLVRPLYEETGERVSARAVGHILSRLGFDVCKDHRSRPRRYTVPQTKIEEAAKRRDIEMFSNNGGNGGIGNMRSQQGQQAMTLDQLTGAFNADIMGERDDDEPNG